MTDANKEKFEERLESDRGKYRLLRLFVDKDRVLQCVKKIAGPKVCRKLKSEIKEFSKGYVCFPDDLVFGKCFLEMETLYRFFWGLFDIEREGYWSYPWYISDSRAFELERKIEPDEFPEWFQEWWGEMRAYAKWIGS